MVVGRKKKRAKTNSSSRAYHAVYEALEKNITSGQLEAGDILPTETMLARQFGVTRHTVREGMRVLEQSGLVERRARRRLHVVLPRYDALAPISSKSLLMQGISILELFEVMMPLEVCAVELAFPNITDALLTRLDDNIGEMKNALAKRRSIVAQDIAFHMIIAEASANRVLILSREPISMLLYPTLTKLFNHPKTRDISPKRLLDAHVRIVEAMRVRDGKSAVLWMSRHLADFRRGYDFAGISLDEQVDTKL